MTDREQPRRRPTLPPVQRCALGLTVLCASLLVVTAAVGDTELERMARELAGLRTQLDGLESQLQTERTRSLAELRSLESRRGALDQQLDAERVRKAAAEKKIEAKRGQLDHRTEKTDVLRPVLERNIDKLKAAIEAGLPYRREERLRELEELRTNIRSGRLDPETGTSRLWHFVEDELKLAGEVVRTKVPLHIGGERRLVDGVRIGMVALYVHDETGYSQLRRHDDGSWALEAVTDPEIQLQLRALFDNLAKQVIEASYLLPLPAPLLTEVAQP